MFSAPQRTPLDASAYYTVEEHRSGRVGGSQRCDGDWEAGSGANHGPNVATHRVPGDAHLVFVAEVMEECSTFGDRSQTHAGKISHSRNGLLIDGDHSAMPVVRDLQDEAADSTADQFIGQLLTGVVSVVVPRRHQKADSRGAPVRFDQSDGRGAGWHGEIGGRLKYAMENVEKSVVVEDTISDIKVENEKITSVVVGHTDITLVGERNDVRTGETNLSKLLTTSMVEKTGADVAITNGGGIRSSISEGDITKGDVISVLPFGNYVVVIEVTGQDIIDAMENGLQSYPNERGAFPHIAGMNVKFDPSKEAFSKVVEVTMADGEVLDLDKTYSLATNDFMAAGGDGYESFVRPVVAEFETLEEVLSAYIGENGVTITTPEGRIQSIR